MSGGSMNYLYCKLENDADFKQTTPERKAFALHLVKVAKALHDIEWVDSCDYRPGDESEAIRACLAPGMALEAAIEAANEAANELREELELACAGKRPNAGVRGAAHKDNHGARAYFRLPLDVTVRGCHESDQVFRKQTRQERRVPKLETRKTNGRISTGARTPHERQGDASILGRTARQALRPAEFDNKVAEMESP